MAGQSELSGYEADEQAGDADAARHTFAVYKQLDLFLSLYKYMSLYLLIPYICGANYLQCRSSTMVPTEYI